MYLFLALMATRCAAQEVTVTRVTPSTKFVEISGRVKNEKDSVIIYWPGTSIRIRFYGTGVKAKLRDEFGKNYFNVVIDGDSLHYIKPDVSKHDYVLASNLTTGNHTIELIKRTEWDLGKTWFYEMTVMGSVIVPDTTRHRVIEFFGNSITAGYAIENYTGSDSPDSIYTNNYFTYAARTARHYNADLYCTVKSGIGLMVSWFPLIMPEMYDRLDPADSLSRWNFDKVTPDIVVINILQNDSWLIKQPDHPSFRQRFGETPPDEKQITRAYRHFVGKIRNAYPHTAIICTLGPMDAVKAGTPWRHYITEAVTQLHDDNVYVHFFPFSDKAGHPRKEENEKMAESLIKFIDANIKW